MTERRLLVIGSQSRRLNHLSFLPEVAVRLHALLREPGPGGCIGVSLGGHPPGLLLDPTVKEAKDAIRVAIHDAAQAAATLILVYIGHGEFPDEMTRDFYLMPTDADEFTYEGAIHFAEFLKNCLTPIQDRVNLVVLLDTCHAGVGAWTSIERLATTKRGNLSFELLTATDDRGTANALLAQGLIELLERGDPEAAERFHCRHVHTRLGQWHRPGQHIVLNADDDRFYLGRNIAHDPGDVFWNDSPGRAQILKQTEYFQPTSDLATLVEASRSHPLVVLTGQAGSGKSTLASSLVRPELTGGSVPAGFVHAVAILGQTTNQRSLADDLERQLHRSIPGFAEAIVEFGRAVPLTVREKLDFLRKKVLGPLEHLVGQPEVRIVLDGFNQLPDSTRATVGQVLGQRLNHIRLIITTQPDTPDCPPGHLLLLGRTSGEALDHYMEARRVSNDARVAILARAENHWLIARLLVDAVLADPEMDLSHLPNTLNDAYARLLDQAGAADAWSDRFRPLLSALAVAGSGPILPLRLLAHASATLGGLADEVAIREVLARLRGLVIRRDPNTPNEHVGLFHPTLIEYLVDPSGDFVVDTQATHGAMVRAIEALAPSVQHHRDDPLHSYAFFHEADHLWATHDDGDLVLKCLTKRESNDPRENLARCRQWPDQFLGRYSANHPSVLICKGQVASYTGATGDVEEALRLSSALMPDYELMLGCDHPCTLTLRNNIAAWIGEHGNAAEALRLFSALLPDQERVLGPDHPDVLDMRNNIAGWTGEHGNVVEALRLFSALLPDQERVLGRDDPRTLTTRHNVALWTGKAGNFGEALRLSVALLPDRERVLGHEHPSTLRTRNNIAAFTGQVGDVGNALRLHSALLPDQERVLGRDHPHTLMTRSNIANFTGQAGDASEALRLCSALLPDQERVLGQNHPHVLLTRNNIAIWIGRAGNPAEELRLLSALLPDQERVLGDSHPNTFLTRQSIANLIGDQGDATEALRLSFALLPDQERVLGHNHPDTLITRYNIARWTGRTGNKSEEWRLFSTLLKDQESVLGRNHPHTLNTFGFIAALTIMKGDWPEGCCQLREGLRRSTQRFGPNHPSTREFQKMILFFGFGEANSPVTIEPR